MKKIFTLIMFTVVALVAAKEVHSQAKVNETLTVAKECLGEIQTITDVNDWGYLQKKDPVPKLPFHKVGYLDSDWAMGLITFGGEPLLVGWPTKSSDLPYTKVFGVLVSQQREPRPNQSIVSLSYRSVGSDCDNERLAVIDLLAADGRFGKSKYIYEW